MSSDLFYAGDNTSYITRQLLLLQCKLNGKLIAASIFIQYPVGATISLMRQLCGEVVGFFKGLWFFGQEET